MTGLFGIENEGIYSAGKGDNGGWAKIDFLE
jgi:hypothetical protein